MQKPFKTSDLVNVIRENIERCAIINESRIEKETDGGLGKEGALTFLHSTQ
jgi:hypothetical protein